MNIEFLKKYEIFKNEELLTLCLLDPQGFCNTNYLLSTSKNRYVIRVFNSEKSSQVDRNFEFSTQRRAYKKRIAPEPLLLDLENSLMISEFSEGLHKLKLKKHELKKLATLLRTLHKIKIKGKFNKDFVLCHHDLNPQNIIFSHKITLIDWEYARVNDRYFDLANICIEFNLSKKKEGYFLHCYFKNSSLWDVKKLYQYKLDYLNCCIVWFEEENNEKEKLGYVKKLNSLKKSTQQSLQGRF